MFAYFITSILNEYLCFVLIQVNLIYQNLKKIIIDLCLIILLLPTKIRYKILDIPSMFDLSQIHIRRKQRILPSLNHILQTLICIVLHSHNPNIELNDIKNMINYSSLEKIVQIFLCRYY